MPFIINNVVEVTSRPDSHIAPFWKMDSTERKLFESRQIPPTLPSRTPTTPSPSRTPASSRTPMDSMKEKELSFMKRQTII